MPHEYGRGNAELSALLKEQIQQRAELGSASEAIGLATFR
jgi:hypothetical protein